MDNYISQIGKGRSFVVVRKSKPVFRLEPLDEWGDEGVWEKVIDSTKIKKEGYPCEKFYLVFLKRNRKILKKDTANQKERCLKI